MSTGFDTRRMRAALVGATKILRDECERVLEQHGTTIVENMKRDHRFKNRTGKLEESMQYEVTSKPHSATLEVFLDYEMTRRGEWSYGWIQHDGSYKGYRQSPITRKVTPHTGKKGIKYDHFLYRSWNNDKKAFIDDVKKIPDVIYRWWGRQF